MEIEAVMKKIETLRDDRKFAMVDICKFIMAFVVIAIHTNPVVNCENMFLVKSVISIENWAVPFFFMASGFFLFYQQDRQEAKCIQRIDGYLKKLIVLYCTWTFLSLPLTIYGYVESGNSLLACILSYIKYFLFVGKLYNSYHLWYLLALIIAVLIIRFMIQRKAKIRDILFVAFAMYIINDCMQYASTENLLLGKFVSLYVYVFNKGGIFTGMIYVVLGMLLAQGKKYLNRGMAIVGVIGICACRLHVSERAGNYLLMAETWLLFMVILSIDIKDRKCYQYLRRYSTVIYVSHLIWYSMYSFIIIKEPNKLGLDSFLVTSLMSFLCAVVLTWLARFEKFAWLKKIT